MVYEMGTDDRPTERDEDTNRKSMFPVPKTPHKNTGWAKKVSLTIFVITLSTVIQFAYFLAHIYYMKFGTGGYIVSPPNMAYVTTLPCKI